MRILRGKQAVAEVERLANRSAAIEPAAEQTAKKVIAAVRKSGDKALLQLAKKLDGLGASQEVRVSGDEIARALSSVSNDFRRALQTAARNIHQLCEGQKP